MSKQEKAEFQWEVEELYLLLQPYFVLDLKIKFDFMHPKGHLKVVAPNLEKKGLWFSMVFFVFEKKRCVLLNGKDCAQKQLSLHPCLLKTQQYKGRCGAKSLFPFS